MNSFWIFYNSTSTPSGYFVSPRTGTSLSPNSFSTTVQMSISFTFKKFELILENTQVFKTSDMNGLPSNLFSQVLPWKFSITNCWKIKIKLDHTKCWHIFTNFPLSFLSFKGAGHFVLWMVCITKNLASGDLNKNERCQSIPFLFPVRDLV